MEWLGVKFNFLFFIFPSLSLFLSSLPAFMYTFFNLSFRQFGFEDRATTVRMELGAEPSEAKFSAPSSTGGHDGHDQLIKIYLTQLFRLCVIQNERANKSQVKRIKHH